MPPEFDPSELPGSPEWAARFLVGKAIPEESFEPPSLASLALRISLLEISVRGLEARLTERTDDGGHSGN